MSVTEHDADPTCDPTKAGDDHGFVDGTCEGCGREYDAEDAYLEREAAYDRWADAEMESDRDFDYGED